jgi:endonuclease/exonuclease/phosphatase (EEP) superfamily protein YafD
VLAAVIAVQAVFILQFTPVWPKQSKRFDPQGDKGQAIRLISANVKMSNRDYAALVDEVAKHSPDILIMMEVDQAWVDGVSGLSFHEVVAHPLDNTYGLLLASKFELEDVSVGCLLTEGVPSIICTVLLPDEQRFRLYCIHPEPPVPYAGAEGRDGETSLIALKAREETLPVVVSGDLNDVAWSRTTRRFRRVSRLLDPRIGRRMVNTFDARYFFIRWPLDHLFHSAHFRLKQMKRLAPGGSDHFPVMFDLVLCPSPEAEAIPDEAEAEDFARAKDLVAQAARRQEKPIGSDWES